MTSFMTMFSFKKNNTFDNFRENDVCDFLWKNYVICFCIQYGFGIENLAIHIISTIMGNENVNYLLFSISLGYFYNTSVLSLHLINFLIPKIPKTDLGSPQIVESDGTLGIAKTSNVPHFYTYFINQKFLVQL